MAKKCGICQQNKIAKRLQAAGSTFPDAAAQPIIGGKAPGHRADQGVRRADSFERRVGKNVNADGGGREERAQPVANHRKINHAGDGERPTPTMSASRGSMRPEGIGRSFVRCMSASTRRSHHWLSAAAPAAAMAVPKTA